MPKRPFAGNLIRSGPGHRGPTSQARLPHREVLVPNRGTLQTSPARTTVTHAMRVPGAPRPPQPGLRSVPPPAAACTTPSSACPNAHSRLQSAQTKRRRFRAASASRMPASRSNAAAQSMSGVMAAVARVTAASNTSVAPGSMPDRASVSTRARSGAQRQSGAVAGHRDAPRNTELPGHSGTRAPRPQPRPHFRSIVAIAEDHRFACPIDIRRLPAFQQQIRLIGRQHATTRTAAEFSSSALRAACPARSVFAIRLATRNETAATGPRSRMFDGKPAHQALATRRPRPILRI